MSKKPKTPGLYWAVLDNGNGNAEIVLLRVGYFSGLTSFDQGAVCEFVDGSEWTFEVKNFDQEMVQPSRIVYAAHRSSTNREQCKLTWHGEAKPPKAAHEQVHLTNASPFPV